jgi:hypothetical protein
MRRGLKALTITILLTSAAASFAAAERHIILDDCVVSGCSNELCTDGKARLVASACIARPENACYQTYGECKRQPNHQCGWTPSLALATCIAHPPAEPGTKPH